MIVVNFENVASHKYVVHTPKSVRIARSAVKGYSFFVLIKKLLSLIALLNCLTIDKSLVRLEILFSNKKM